MKNKLFATIAVCIVGIFATSCGGKGTSPVEIPVNADLDVSMATVVVDGGRITPSDSIVIAETVHIANLIQYPENGDSVTVPFKFKDVDKYADITEKNIDKRIAIIANGRIVSMPVVKMKLGNGACSFLLSKEDAKALFPNAVMK